MIFGNSLMMGQKGGIEVLGITSQEIAYGVNTLILRLDEMFPDFVPGDTAVVALATAYGSSPYGATVSFRTSAGGSTINLGSGTRSTLTSGTWWYTRLNSWVHVTSKDPGSLWYNVTVTRPQATNQGCAIAIMHLRGVSFDNAMDVESQLSFSTATSGSSTTMIVPNITTATHGALVVVAAGGRSLPNNFQTNSMWDAARIQGHSPGWGAAVGLAAYVSKGAGIQTIPNFGQGSSMGGLTAALRPQ